MRNKEKNDKKKEYRNESEIKPKRRKKVLKQKYNHIKFWLDEDSSDVA